LKPRGRLTRERVDEETTAHADLAVNAPHGEINPTGLERLAPREHVLIDAVDECSIEIEKKGLSSYVCVLIISRSVVSHLFILPFVEKRIAAV
jgi:hypothetical protein